MGRAAKGEQKGTGHWAAPCVQEHQRKRAKIEVSWLLQAVDKKAERRGLECEYIAVYRWKMGRNPDCQFVALDKDR